MLKQNVLKALGEQVIREYHSAYIYLGMATYFSSIGFEGFANWMNMQVKEEMAHGMHMYEYIIERGETLDLPEIPSVTINYENAIDVFEKTLAHERFVSENINKIASLAMEEKDHATYQFIQWFVNEQVEEESTTESILQKLKHIGDDKGLLFTMDKELSGRKFVDSFAGGE